MTRTRVAPTVPAWISITRIGMVLLGILAVGGVIWVECRSYGDIRFGMTVDEVSEAVQSAPDHVCSIGSGQLVWWLAEGQVSEGGGPVEDNSPGDLMAPAHRIKSIREARYAYGTFQALFNAGGRMVAYVAEAGEEDWIRTIDGDQFGGALRDLDDEFVQRLINR